MKSKTKPNSIRMALGAVVLSAAWANAQSLTHVATTQLNTNGDAFGVSVKAGAAKYKKSTALGEGTGTYGDGTLLDWRIETGVNGQNPFAGNTVSSGGGAYFDVPVCAEVVYTPSNYLKVYTSADIDVAGFTGADITTGTNPQIGSSAVPLVGNINISGLSDGQFYMVAGSFSQSMTLTVTMTGPGQPTLTDTKIVSPGGSFNRLHSVEWAFTNPGGLYNNIEYKYNGGSNLGRRRYGGVLLDGTIYVDTTPPNWVATWPQVDTLASTSFTVRAEINEPGTGYYVVLPSGATAPGAAQVKAGNDASDSPALASGSIALTALTENTAPVTGLTPSTGYDIWFVAQDAAAIPNLQASPAVVSVSTTAPDNTPPVWGTTWPQVDTLTPTSLVARVETNEVGNAYFVVLASGATAPTSAQVKAGTDATNAPALKSGSMALNAANVEKTASVTGLPPSVAYDVWFVAQDAEAVPNLQVSPVLVSVTLPTPVSQFATGTFTWGTASVWAASSAGSYTDSWAPGNDAVLEGAAGTISVPASGVSVHDITFDTSGYIISGNTLTLSGTTQPTLSVATDSSIIVTSAVTGTAGFKKSGPGTLDLNSLTNSFTGGVTLDGGNIGFGAAGGLNGNNISVIANTFLRIPTTTVTSDIALATGTSLSFGMNTGTFTTTGAVTGEGGVTLAQQGGGATRLVFSSIANTFSGPIVMRNTAQESRLTVNSLGDATTLGSGDITFGASGTVPHLFIYGSGASAPLALTNRRFDLAGSQTAMTIGNDSSQTFTINTDLVVSGSGTKTLTLAGTGAGVSTFAGDIGNGSATVAISKSGSGTWVLRGDNTYTGTTTVTGGTLALVGGSQASPITVNNGTKLGFTLGSPTTSTSSLTLGGTSTITITGTPNGTSDYLLMTATSITGTPMLDGPVSGYSIEVQGSGTKLVLVAPAPSATLVIDLGTGTVIEGGAFGTFGATNLPIPALPVGSILRSVSVDAAITATDNLNFASDLAILFDPTPGTPGGDFSLRMTSGALTFGATNQLAWSGGASGPPATLVETKNAAQWAAVGPIDLATYGVFLGNAFQDAGWMSPEGGTWSGTITLTYDLVGAGNSFDTWAETGTQGPVTFDGDTNGDGVPDGTAFLLGVANPDDDANGSLPTVTADGSGNLVMQFNCLPVADRGTAELRVAHSNTLASFTATVDQVPDSDDAVPDNQVTFVVDTVSEAPLNKITATISSAAAAGGKLFGRLAAVDGVAPE